MGCILWGTVALIVLLFVVVGMSLCLAVVFRRCVRAVFIAFMVPPEGKDPDV